MSAPAAPAPAPAAAPGVGGAGAGGAGAGGRRHLLRGWLAIGLALALALAVAVWSSRDTERYEDPLDPQNPGPQGARAVAEVLADEGVEVEVVRSAAELEETDVDDGTTVVVTGTDRLSRSTTRRLTEHAADARLVLVEPPFAVLEQLGLGTDVGYADDGRHEADCADPAYDGLRITVDSAFSYPSGSGTGAGCFPAGDGHLLLGTEAGAVLLGAGQALTNDQVLRGDNAAVALRLLGQDQRLVWYLPSYEDAAEDEAVTIRSLLPPWVVPGLWTALLALVALVLWRYRRLGPLSVEPLPVVVRAAETARSRGRMYRRADDRGHAAAALRAAARRRLAARLRLGRAADEAALLDAVAQQTGRPPAELDPLLSTAAPPPASDQELVRLASELARLMREVRRA